MSYDKDGKMAAEVAKSTGVTVLSHRAKKPGCGDEIMEYFRQHPETGVTRPHQIAVVGDRLFTDMMLANRMGSWGIWVKDGVVPLNEKSIVSVEASAIAPAKSLIDSLAVLQNGTQDRPIPTVTWLLAIRAQQPI
jgi:phosphatidylglycerophosphatase GEP4